MKNNKHLVEAKMGYWKHWFHATSAGLALLIHAWFPNLLDKYASDKLCNH